MYIKEEKKESLVAVSQKKKRVNQQKELETFELKDARPHGGVKLWNGGAAPELALFL